jgi:lysyl-tRNA synthetase class 2
VHIHHAVPGVILMVAGGLGGLAAQSTGWRALAGIGFGIGLALVLDEFALILHLQDVYWTDEGRTSVDAVLLAGAVLVLVVLGADPFSAEAEAGTSGTAIVIAINLVFALVCFLKGKIGTGVIGVVVPMVAFVGAVRIGRPKSPWAHRRYPEGSHQAEKAQARDERFEARWRSKLHAFQDKVAGFGS